jgi:hypothetical protein
MTTKTQQPLAPVDVVVRKICNKRAINMISCFGRSDDAYEDIGQPPMDTHGHHNSSSVTTIKITSHSPLSRSFVSAVEGVQLPSPFLLGSNALATAAAPASPIWLPAVKRVEGTEVAMMVGW